MKTKQLIQLLQEADPTGEHEVVIDNTPISFLWAEPAYYDGCFQQFIYADGNSRPIAAKYVGSGTKVHIRTHSIVDEMLDNPSLEVTYEGMSEKKAEDYRQYIERERAEILQMFVAPVTQKKVS